MKSLSQKRLSALLKNFSKKRILVLGDVGVDKYTIGRVHRISPEAPIPIIEVTETNLKLGLAANVADNIAALGGSPLLVSVIGHDTAARDFRALLKKSSISEDYLVVDDTRPTTLKERVIAESQQVCRVDHESKLVLSAALHKALLKKLLAALAKADAVIIEDYAKGLLQSSLSQTVIAEARSRNVPVLVDPNRNSPASLYQDCTVITPNVLEAEALTRIEITNEQSLERAGRRLLELTNADVAIITRGKDGMALFEKARPKLVTYIPTFAQEVFDVSGAGDTVIAALALSLVSQAKLPEAAYIANAAAGIEVGKRGTATVDRKELAEYCAARTKLLRH